MAIRLNEMRRNPRTGRLERTGRQEVIGRRRGSSGGFEQGTVGTYDPRTGESNIEPGAVSNERGALIEARFEEERRATEKVRQDAQAAKEQQQLVRTMESDQAVASTVGPGGRPSVIRQTTGGFSAVAPGGVAGFGVEARQTAVPIAGAAPVPTPSRSQPRVNYGTVEPAPRRNFFQRTFGGITTGFGQGVRSDPVGDLFAGSDSSSVFAAPSDIRAATPSQAAFVAGRATRGIGEVGVTVAGFGLARRGAVAASSAVASRARGVGTFGVPLLVGGGIAIGGSAVGRAAETRTIRSSETFNVPGVDVRGAIDEGTESYAAGSGIGRNIVESISFGRFADRPRFERSVSESLERRGVSSVRSRELATNAFETRARIRARTDVVTALGGELSGEVAGRAANLALDRRAVGLVTPRAFAVRRFIGTGIGGIAEGGVQAASSDIQSSGRVNPRNVAGGAVAGGAIAGTAGATIGYLGVIGTTPARSRVSRFTSGAIETGLDIIDPFERPGDVTADSFYSSLAQRRRVPFSGVRTVSVQREGRPSANLVATDVGMTSTPVRTFASASAARSRSPGFFSGFANARTPSRSVSPFVSTPGRSIVPNFGFGTLVPSPARSVTPTRNTVPSRQVIPSRQIVPSRSNLPSLIPTPSRNLVPNFIPTRPSQRENVPSRTPVFDGGGFLPPLGGFFGGGRGGRGSGRAGRSAFAPSFTALAFNIRGRGRSRQSSGFTGLEVRGI